MDKIFETMPVGKRMTRTEVDSLHELLKKTEINVSHAPKKLTLSEINEHNMEDFVEDITNSLNEMKSLISRCLSRTSRSFKHSTERWLE